MCTLGSCAGLWLVHGSASIVRSSFRNYEDGKVGSPRWQSLLFQVLGFLEKALKMGLTPPRCSLWGRWVSELMGL